jgi:hypothetical protein
VQTVEKVGQLYKPGHWTGFSVEEARANNFDVFGDLAVWTVDPKFQAADHQRPVNEPSVNTPVGGRYQIAKWQIDEKRRCASVS